MHFLLGRTMDWLLRRLRMLLPTIVIVTPGRNRIVSEWGVKEVCNWTEVYEAPEWTTEYHRVTGKIRR